MGSVIDFIECPNCSQEAYSDFYYKSGEQYVSCSSCDIFILSIGREMMRVNLKHWMVPTIIVLIT